MSTTTKNPNPRRVAAGRRNRLKRQGLTKAGRQRLKESALVHQPWLRSTGPVTKEGKARVAQNGKSRQIGPKSGREMRTQVQAVCHQIQQMRELRLQIEGERKQ